MKTNRSSRTGGMLVVVMAIVVTLSLLVIALLNLGKFNAFETERQLKLTKARWIAEAGFEKAAAIIRANAQTLGNVPNELNEDFEGDAAKGRYEVAISDTPGPGVAETTFVITSTGKVNDVLSGTVEAAVKVEMRGAPGVDQSLIALSGVSKISGANSLIEGDVYVNGTLQARGVTANENGGQSSGINGVVELGGADSTSNHAGSREVLEEDLNLPPLDRSSYTNALQAASSYTNLNLTFNNANDFTNNLVNGTNYVNGNLTVKTDVPANRTIVVKGTVTFPNAGIIGSGVKIVAEGDVSFGNHITLGTQTEIFTLDDISFATQGTTATNGTTLLAMGDIDEAKNMDFSGIMYAEGRVNITAGSTIRGTVVAGTGFDVAANVTVTYDPSVFAVPNPLDFLSWVLTERRQWQESPF